MVKEKVAEIHSLKAQLNNMEQCYIEKKKECEGCRVGLIKRYQ